jgi:hypothetical protein
MRYLISLLACAALLIGGAPQLTANPLVLLSGSPPAADEGGITLVASSSARSTDGNSITTGANDTTGATFLVATIGDYGLSSTTTVVDSKGNTWTQLNVLTALSSVHNSIFYCESPIVGAGHTFTANGTTSYPSICVAAFAGVGATPFDQQNGTANGGSGTTLTTGSVTPGTDNQLVIAALGFTDSGAAIDSGFTIVQQQPNVSSESIGSALAYKVQTTAAAVNPEWSWGSSATAAAVIATFEKAP